MESAIVKKWRLRVVPYVLLILQRLIEIDLMVEVDRLSTKK